MNVGDARETIRTLLWALARRDGVPLEVVALAFGVVLDEEGMPL